MVGGGGRYLFFFYSPVFVKGILLSFFFPLGDVFITRSERFITYDRRSVLYMLTSFRPFSPFSRSFLQGQQFLFSVGFSKKAFFFPQCRSISLREHLILVTFVFLSRFVRVVTLFLFRNGGNNNQRCESPRTRLSLQLLSHHTLSPFLNHSTTSKRTIFSFAPLRSTHTTYHRTSTPPYLPDSRMRQ